VFLKPANGVRCFSGIYLFPMLLAIHGQIS
jgi:hypothetical protein